MARLKFLENNYVDLLVPFLEHLRDYLPIFNYV